MKKKNLLFGIVLISLACQKEKAGPSSSSINCDTTIDLNGHILHHGTSIPDARVLLKFNDSEFPGFSEDFYDRSTTSDQLGNFNFHDIIPGNHYIFAFGYDNRVRDSVSGGLPIKLKDDDTIVSRDVFVTE